jgi:hypothetical protein
LEFKEYGKKYDLSMINGAVEEIIKNNRDWPIEKFFGFIFFESSFCLICHFLK